MVDFIGVIDSGIGGLTVLRNLQKQYPYSYVYLADHAFCPYGLKSNETVRSRAFALTRFLAENGAKAVVLACNTLSAYARELQSAFDVPICDVIGPTCNYIRQNTKFKRIALLATKSTINNGMYGKILGQCGIEVVNFDCSGFVPYIEQHAVTSIACQRVMHNALCNLPRLNVDAVVLGCTHFPLVRKQITYYCPNSEIVECRCELPSNIVEFDDSNRKVKYITTGNVEFANHASSVFRDSEIRFERVVLT